MSLKLLVGSDTGFADYEAVDGTDNTQEECEDDLDKCDHSINLQILCQHGLLSPENIEAHNKMLKIKTLT